jgi:FlgD Ig-like domain
MNAPRFKKKFIIVIPTLMLLVSLISPTARAQEYGPDDFQISDTGITADPATDALDPDVAYDVIHNQFLVVWSADDTSGDYLIYGRLINAQTQAFIAPKFLISSGGLNVMSQTPAVTFNKTTGEYLVVWSSDVLIPDQFRIHGQRLRYDGAKLGNPDFLISTMDHLNASAHDAYAPDVASLETEPGYLVVWTAHNYHDSEADGTLQIYGQHLASTDATLVGGEMHVSSDVWTGAHDALSPEIVANNTSGEYLVVYELSYEDTGYYPEILGRRVSTTWTTGTPFQISQTGNHGARNPTAVHNPIDNTYLVVWDGDQEESGVPQIHGQRLAADGTEIGLDDFMISNSLATVGKDVVMPSMRAIEPAVDFDPLAGSYFVVWQGHANSTEANDTEIFCRNIYGDNTDAGSLEGPISNMGLYAVPDYNAHTPSVAFSTHNSLNLAVWSGDLLFTNSAGETEIFGQAWSLGVTSIDDQPDVPQPVVYDFELKPNQPNPFNPSTKISYTLPGASYVHLEIYDVAGRLIKKLVDEYQGAGLHETTWNGTNVLGRPVASGTYISRLSDESQSQSRTLNLLK